LQSSADMPPAGFQIAWMPVIPDGPVHR
jgi:hypothetical protein